MKPLRWTLAVAGLLVAGLLYAIGFVGSSSARVARDHSLTLPPSASNIRCRDFFSITTFGDFDAEASFEVASEDLPALLSQVRWLPDTPADTSLQVRSLVPAAFGAPSSSRVGTSRHGNGLLFETYRLDRSRTGVWVHTQHN